VIRKVLLVKGIVQGVGFRPFCAKLAKELKLGGSVQNNSSGVLIELCGSNENIDEFSKRLLDEAPPLAMIQTIEIISEEKLLGPIGEFTIKASERQEMQLVLIPPDIATCDDCLQEMRDPNDKRYRYPFINCTNCGPRYTIIKELPYDRTKTTMACFPMCDDCSSEYNDVTDRRYHAQPNACPECGPTLWLCDARGKRLASNDEAIALAKAHLKAGHILAVKGIGGYHLACDPRNDEAVRALRARKKRPDKPFALMAKDFKAAEKVVLLNGMARKLLASPRRPIVVCPKAKGCGPLLSAYVAPNIDTYGVMLPYTPIQHLLLEDEDLDLLIMTSANLSDEPLVAGNREALQKLASITDYYLMHDRDIYVKIDDSVIAMAGNTPIFTRRARGYVPQPYISKDVLPPIFGAGGEMKSTFSVSHDHYIFTSQYLGDLKEVASIALYEHVMDMFLSLYEISPLFLVHDKHPMYLSTKIAKDKLPEVKDSLAVQHHHAHLAACLWDNDFQGEAMGLILDGTGFGDDGNIWGGEILVGNAKSFIRWGHLLEAPLPGGDKAVLEPWRFALSILLKTFGLDKSMELADKFWPDRKRTSEALIRNMNIYVKTSSAGRLFDAVASLLGLRDAVTYDAQAAIELEALAKGRECAPFRLERENGHLILDWRPAIEWLIMGLMGGKRKERLAAGFHDGFAAALAQACKDISLETGIRHVALSGGVWQNKRLLNVTCALLRRAGLEPLVHKNTSPNDECISLGQIAIGIERWSK